MRARIQDMRNRLEREKGRKAQVEKDLATTTATIKEKQRDLRRHEQARELIKEASLRTQRQLQYHISDITSLALGAVFPDPYELEAEFVERRNKTECDLFFTRDGERSDPISAAGGGAVDVASFALRVASWSMRRPRSRNVLVLDEPFKHLSTELLPKASEMIKELAEKLELQIIMVTHSEELVEAADKVFQTAIKKGITEVRDG